MDVVSILKDIGPGLWMTILGAAYASGFIVLGSHLQAYGVTDFALIATRCWIASISFLLFILSFGLFAGTAVFRLRADGAEYLGCIPQSGWGLALLPLGLITPYSKLAFNIGVSTTLFAKVAMNVEVPPFVWASQLVLFSLVYLADHSSRMQRSGIARLLIEFGFTLAGTVVFARAVGQVFPLVFVVLPYVGITFCLNLVFERFERGPITRHLSVFTALFAVIFAITVASIFGTAVYRYVKPTLGGPWTPAVTLRLSEGSLPDIKEPAGTTIHGTLVYRTEAALMIESNGSLLSLPTSDVHGIVYHVDAPLRQKTDSKGGPH